MSEYTYTAKDFEQAEFAIDPSEDHQLARRWVRFYVDDDLPWKNGHGVWRTSEEMAEGRCIPVYAEPYSPEALQRAWERGEKPKPDERATEGTVSIAATDRHLGLYVNGDEESFTSIERIIYRPPASEPAPERDPVADLAQALEDALPEEAGSPVALRRYAESLAGYGVRVVTDGG